VRRVCCRRLLPSSLVDHGTAVGVAHGRCREGRWSVVFASSRGRRYMASAANRARSRLFQQARCGAVLHPTCRVSARLPPVVWTGIASNSLCPTTPRPAYRRAPLAKRPSSPAAQHPCPRSCTLVLMLVLVRVLVLRTVHLSKPWAQRPPRLHRIGRRSRSMGAHMRYVVHG
jgi:hypothetical protein